MSLTLPLSRTGHSLRAALFLAALVFPVAASAGFPVTLRVDLPAEGAGEPARPDLLGNNLQWTGYGDSVLQSASLDFNPVVVRQAKELEPPILRYPGGTLSDLYHWRNGLGPLATRGACEQPGQPRQTVYFGTVEFLELCRQTGARPMITVNVISGSPEEAAEWVRQINITGLQSPVTGARLPRVDLWEIGNEPYLINGDKPPDKDIMPAEFCAKVNAFIAAMKAVDPAIKVLVPFRMPTWGGHATTPYPDFNTVLLAGLRHPVDYAAIHNAYAPATFVVNSKLTDEIQFRATMAASRTVADDLASTLAVIDAHPGFASSGLAITEYAPLYSLTFKEKTDSYVTTLAGALYVADVLRVFATTPRVAMAQYWSLAGNWFFGAVDPADRNGNPRPVYWSLYAYRRLLQGVMAPVSVTGPTFDNESAGLVPAYHGTPTVSAVATLANGTLRVMVINKDLKDPASLTLEVAPLRSPAGPARCFAVSGPAPFAYANEVSVKSGMLPLKRLPIRLVLPEHSFLLLELPLQ